MAKFTYSLLMPPPNLTGELHLGHAMQHSILDAIARYQRMLGKQVLLLPGVDHAGIQFEGTLDRILSKEGLTKAKLGREAWLKKAWRFKEEVYQSFHQTWSVFGLSADWDQEVFTLDPKVQQAVVAQFQSFWDDDLLYKGAYLINWCPKCGTAIEDVEMEYQEKKERLYFMKYLVQGESSITVATARPETIFADVAIAIYPHHPKYHHLVGKQAINPLTKTQIPILEDKRVDKKFGTGALKITPGHDPLDYAIGKDHQLPILHVIDKSGRMTDLAGKLAGLKVTEAREKAIRKLGGSIEKVEDYTHSVPVCERCKTTVEPLISEEWFVKMQPLADKALTKIKQINFKPSHYLKLLTDWLKEIHDWCISRTLWWGHRIPVWYCSKCNPHHLVGKDRDMVISLQEPGKSCQSCSQKHWVQDEAILDTWFSSGLWPLATLGWPEKTEELDKYYPWDFEISGGDIKYLWIARMIMLSVWHTGQIPFTNMFFHGMIRDLQGRRFSKSLGNGIDPNDLREAWETDATRMAMYTYCAPGRDGRASRSTLDERCKNYRNFITKLKNIYRFIYELGPTEGRPGGRQPDRTSLDATASLQHDDDLEILRKLDLLTRNTAKHLEEFNLHLATEALYEFIWHQFADIYLEKTKDRRGAAQPTLEQVFTTSLRLLYPFMPFTTVELWQKLGQPKDIAESGWPKVT